MMKNNETISDLRTALIMGASGGHSTFRCEKIGESTFCDGALHHAGNPAKVEALAADIKAAVAQAISARADVDNAREVEQLFQKTIEASGRIDVVVHTVGIMPLSPIASAEFLGNEPAVPGQDGFRSDHLRDLLEGFAAEALADFGQTDAFGVSQS
jgi:NADP-dependent 3-hydroxy acid dehydrogenase YdfG